MGDVPSDPPTPPSPAEREEANSRSSTLRTNSLKRMNLFRSSAIVNLLNGTRKSLEQPPASTASSGRDDLSLDGFFVVHDEKSISTTLCEMSTSLARRACNDVLSRTHSRLQNGPAPAAWLFGTFRNYMTKILAEKNDNKYTRQNSKEATVVTIVLVEAKGLPGPPDDGASHGIYSKFRLGSQSQKSKIVPNTRQPKWNQRFKLRLNRHYSLQISLWDKGKQKNFMGSCTLDLSSLERERTHELWRPLDDGFGSVHFSVTMCTAGSAESPVCESLQDLENVQQKFAWYNLNKHWSSVGQLHVKVHGAKGLSGKPNAYCVLELDNERVQTHRAGTSTDPSWNKIYMFTVRDVTSTLDVSVYDSSLASILQNGFLGKVSIPLLRICNKEKRWFALKDKSRRNSARGNCPRILLETTMMWNPVKATARMFRPKEVKYIKKSKKFNIALVYSNIEFIRDIFHVLYDINEGYKRLFEWENQELSAVALICWLMFWFFFRIWMLPILMLLPFFYFGLRRTSYDDLSESAQPKEEQDTDLFNEREETSLTGRIQGMPEMTLTITNGIEYIASAAERLYNLVSFKVPFLSNVAIVLLLGLSFVFYVIPFNYLLMAFGIYKFSRKYFNPERELNNDLLDFLSHIPDNETLKDWKELNVPEPNQPRSSTRLARSHSSHR